MPSGGRRMVINTQERAISTDMNRLQSFLAKDRAETMRYLLDVSAGTDDFDAGALDTEFTTQENPLRGEILNGILVQPQGGSLNLLVSPGASSVLDPDTSPSADDSAYKFVRTVGVTTLGALTITGNISGFTRIDIVECQRVENNVETDNRDIFNPITGLFTASTVTKGQASEFTYRVRAGTPNAGFPGTAQGWMPLAVVSVPTGSVTVDTMTFWDVRPLVNDRVYGMSNLSLTSPRKRRSMGNVLISGASTLVAGTWEWDVGGRRLGGLIRRGTPGADANNVDISAAANQEVGFTPSSSALIYLYLLTPFGLPRWARYTDGPAGRVPRSPRGIPVISTTAPKIDGTPSAAISLPTSTGFGGTTSTGVCIIAMPTASVTPFGQNGTDDGVAFIGGGAVFGSVFPLNASALATGGGFSTVTFNAPFAGQNPTPPNAKALYIVVLVQENGTITGSSNYFMEPIYFEIFDNGGNIIAVVPTMPQWFGNGNVAAVNLQWGAHARIPVPRNYPTLSLASWQLTLRYKTIFSAPFSGSLLAYGWEL